MIAVKELEWTFRGGLFLISMGRHDVNKFFYAIGLGSTIFIFLLILSMLGVAAWRLLFN